MNKRAALNVSVNFLVIIIICIVVFSLSVYIIKRFFTQAEEIKMIYDERTEKEIERLLDDGSKVAVPFDKKTIYNNKFGTFGIGVLNILDTASDNKFKIMVNFTKAYDKKNQEICQTGCGPPNSWLKISYGEKQPEEPIIIEPTIKNNEQKKFLIGVEPKKALSGLYIFDLLVKYENKTGGWERYDALHKLYVEVP